MKKLILTLYLLFTINNIYAGGACVPAINNNYSNATVLVVGAAAINGTTCGGTIEAGESLSCNSTANQTVWYKFIATSTTSYVTITTTGSCYVGSGVYTGLVLPNSLCSLQSCQAAANGPLIEVHQLVTVIGQTYNIQITYISGGICGNEGTFTIGVTTTCAACIIVNTPPSTTCAAAPTGCYFTSPPSIPTVTATCPSYPLVNGPNIVNNNFYTFTTPSSNAITLNFQNIISSTCGVGNVNWWIWKLFDSSCNIITCGDLSTLNYLNTSCNTQYTIQYMWEEANCTYTTSYPFQYTDGTVGCGAPLPVELISFTGKELNGKNKIIWVTASETNSKYFILERSVDGINWKQISTVDINSKKHYEILDYNFIIGINYYKLKEIDVDNKSKEFDTISIDNSSSENLKPIKITNLIGQEVSIEYVGLKYFIFEDGSIIKKY